MPIIVNTKTNRFKYSHSSDVKRITESNTNWVLTQVDYDTVTLGKSYPVTCKAFAMLKLHSINWQVIVDLDGRTKTHRIVINEYGQKTDLPVAIGVKYLSKRYPYLGAYVRAEVKRVIGSCHGIAAHSLYRGVIGRKVGKSSRFFVRNVSGLGFSHKNKWANR